MAELGGNPPNSIVPGPYVASTASVPPLGPQPAGQGGYASDSGAYANIKKRPIVVPGLKNVQQVMAAPPTVAISLTNPIPSGQLYTATNQNTGSLSAPFNTANFTITRAGNPTVGGTTFPNFDYLAFNSVFNGGANVVGLSVIFSGTVLVLELKDLNTSIMIKVNDQYTSLTPTATGSSGSATFLSVTFSAAVTAVRIDFFASDILGSFSFRGMFTGSLTDTLEPAEIRGPRVIVLGDSVTAATGATHQTLGFVGVFAEYMGWDDVWPSGIGGTGMISTNGISNYIGRLATDVFPFYPDEVIIAGWYNDNASTMLAIRAAASALIAAIRQNLPTCRITFFGPYTPYGSGYQYGTNAATGVGFVATRTGVGQAIAAANDPLVRWIDPSTFPLNQMSSIPLSAQQLANNTTTLSASVAANATAIHTVIPLLTGCQYQFADGSRCRVLSIAGTIATVDQVINAQANGATIALVGNCWISGKGFQGNTTGVGNADNFIFTDDVHPVNLGHLHLGICLAQQYVANLNT